MNLQNAVALITGGSSGIGRAIAQTLAASGAPVAITGRADRRLRETAGALRVHAIRADVTKEADVDRTYREVLEKFGDLDILVNNAGFGSSKASWTSTSPASSPSSPPTLPARCSWPAAPHGTS